jgi:glycerate kinase
MADGGEGTVQAMIQAVGGTLVSVQVKGPLGQPVDASFGILDDEEKIAVIEMAAASGLPLVRPEQRNPMITTTYGTGQLIQAALDRGARKIIIGIGGSATVDGGAGAAMALGAKLLDKNNDPIPLGGRGLKKLHKIDMSGFDSRIAKTSILVASDVDNPLTGLKGAARVFGPQKGATPEMVEMLDENLKHYAEIIRNQLGMDIENTPGAGAAGGLGSSLIAFLITKYKSIFNDHASGERSLFENKTKAIAPIVNTLVTSSNKPPILFSSGDIILYNIFYRLTNLYRPARFL